MDVHLFDEGQLLDLATNDVVQEDNAEEIKLEGIDVAMWEQKDCVWVVPQEHRLEVLYEHQNSYML